MVIKSRATSRGSCFTCSVKKLFACFLLGIVFLFLVFSWLKSPEVPNTHDSLETQDPHLVLSKNKFVSWKTNEFVNISAEVRKRMRDVKVEASRFGFQFHDQPMNIHIREVELKDRSQSGIRNAKLSENQESSSPDSLTVLLLHGAKFSSETWVDIGTLQLIAAMGLHAIAIDLPGHGLSPSKNTRADDNMSAEFLAMFIRRRRLDRPVIVSPSMSGKYSIPYLMRPSPESCGARARAFVALAPVRTEMFTHAQYHRCEIPVMISYGSKDVHFGLTAVTNLRNLPNKEVFVMEGAGHANYKERPDEWHRLLYNFLLAVKKPAESQE